MDINLGKLIDQKKYKKALFFLSEIDKGNKSIRSYFLLGVFILNLTKLKTAFIIIN